MTVQFIKINSLECLTTMKTQDGYKSVIFNQKSLYLTLIMTSAVIFLLSWIVICVTSDQELPAQCTNGFMERQVLIQRASKIGTAATDVSANVLGRNQFLVIPGMNFSCSGSISSFLLGVDVRNLPGNTLRVDLWRPQIESGHVLRYDWVREAHRFITINPGTFSPDGLLEFSLSEKVKFQAGDVLGVWQPHSIDNRVRLFYTNELTPPLAYDINQRYIFSTGTINGTGHELFHGTILLLPVTDNDACLNGFLSKTELKEQTLKVNINGVVNRPEQQRLFPNIHFTCNGSITKWIVGAQTRSVGITDELATLQIWRRTRGTNLYTQVGSSNLDASTSISSGLVEYTPNPPLEFQEGDILGVYQPRADQSKSVLYYQRSTGPDSYGYTGHVPLDSITLNDDLKFTKFDYPLVNVEVTKQGINRMVPIESSLPLPTVKMETNDNNTTISLLIIGGVLLVVFLVVVIMVAVCMWRKKHSKMSSHVVVMEQQSNSREEALFMQDNASYERLSQKQFSTLMTDQSLSETLSYYAKVQLHQRNLCGSTESTGSTGVKEVVYENIPQTDDRNSDNMSSVTIVMVDNPAYRAHNYIN